MIGKKFSEVFNNREDRLTYHSVSLTKISPEIQLQKKGAELAQLPTLSVEGITLETSGKDVCGVGLGELSILKMAQKYAHSPTNNPNDITSIASKVKTIVLYIFKKKRTPLLTP